METGDEDEVEKIIYSIYSFVAFVVKFELYRRK